MLCSEGEYVSLKYSPQSLLRKLCKIGLFDSLIYMILPADQSGPRYLLSVQPWLLLLVR